MTRQHRMILFATLALLATAGLTWLRLAPIPPAPAPLAAHTPSQAPAPAPAPRAEEQKTNDDAVRALEQRIALLEQALAERARESTAAHPAPTAPAPRARPDRDEAREAPDAMPSAAEVARARDEMVRRAEDVLARSEPDTAATEAVRRGFEHLAEQGLGAGVSLTDAECTVDGCRIELVHDELHDGAVLDGLALALPTGSEATLVPIVKHGEVVGTLAYAQLGSGQ